MAKFLFPANPEENDIVEVTPGRKMIFSGGRWRLHMLNVPLASGPTNMGNPPIVAETPPLLPNTNPFWYDSTRGVMMFNDGLTNTWVES